MREFTGDFETHLTVSPGDHDALESWARGHGLRYARIVLDRGAAPDQPMLTVRGRGTLTAQREAARALADGSHHRFVTQRCREVGLPEARRRPDALLAELAEAGYPVLEAEAEFVVVDDNPALDAGWIDERPTA